MASVPKRQLAGLGNFDWEVIVGVAEQLPWDKQEFERQLRAKGDRYHIHHPFQVRMNKGESTREQVAVCNSLLSAVHPAEGRRDPVQLSR
jgi:hypothetical protein